MNRTAWLKSVGFCLVVVTTLPGIGWADPVGTADRPQVLNPGTFDLNGSTQSTFLTTDGIGFVALYYDPNPACEGVPPRFAQLFLFNLEGLYIDTFGADTFPISPQGIPAPKYRLLLKVFLPVTSIPVTPGDYKFTFLVRDCLDMKSVVLPEFVVFSVFAP